jgi:hypothetical protein
MSVDQEKQKGRERTEGCPWSRVAGRSSPRQQARRGLDGVCRTSTKPRRTTMELPGCVRGARRVLGAASARVRGKESEWGTGQLEKGRDGDRHGVHGDALVVRRRFGGKVSTGGTHRRQRAASERAAGLTSGARGTARQVGPTGHREGEGGGKRVGAGWRRQAGTTCQREAGARGA